MVGFDLCLSKAYSSRRYYRKTALVKILPHFNIITRVLAITFEFAAALRIVKSRDEKVRAEETWLGI
jgi:hypothetical protein